jgi:hypothetical protein
MSESADNASCTCSSTELSDDERERHARESPDHLLGTLVARLKRLANAFACARA